MLKGVEIRHECEFCSRVYILDKTDQLPVKFCFIVGCVVLEALVLQMFNWVVNVLNFFEDFQSCPSDCHNGRYQVEAIEFAVHNILHCWFIVICCATSLMMCIRVTFRPVSVISVNRIRFLNTIWPYHV